MRGGAERAAGQGGARGGGEGAGPAAGAGSFAAGVLADYSALQPQVGGGQPGAGSEQQAQQAGRDAVGRAGHHPERAARQPQGGGVGVDDGEASVRASEASGLGGGEASETVPEPGDPGRMQLDRDDPGAGPDQVRGE